MMKPSKCKCTKFFSSFYYVDLGGRNNFKLKVRKEKKNQRQQYSVKNWRLLSKSTWWCHLNLYVKNNFRQDIIISSFVHSRYICFPFQFREAKSSLCRALECSDLRMAMASQTEIQRKNKGSKRGNTGHDLH